MKKTLFGILLCGAIWAVGSGCNNAEPAPPTPAPQAAAPAPQAGMPAGVQSQIPANAPSSVKQYMERANRSNTGGSPPGGMGYGAPAGYGGR